MVDEAIFTLVRLITKENPLGRVFLGLPMLQVGRRLCAQRSAPNGATLALRSPPLNDELGYSFEKLPYRVFDKSGKFIVAGHTDQDGLTDRVHTNYRLS